LVGDTGHPGDFKWAFLAGAIGMLASVVVQLAFAKQYVIDPNNKVLGQPPVGAHAYWSKPLFIILGLAAFASLAIGMLYIDAKVFVFLPYLLLLATIFIVGIIITDKSLTKIEKQRVSVIFIVAFFVIFFWSAFEQAGASLTFFADEQTDRHLGLALPSWIIYPLGIVVLFFITKLFKTTKKALGAAVDTRLRNTVYVLLSAFAIAILYGVSSIALSGKQQLTLNDLPASTFQSLNSIFVVSFAPLFAWLWLKLGKYEPAAPTKMAIGLFLLSLGYLWIAFGVRNVAPGLKESMIWLVGMYALHTWGELSLSPIGLSLVNKMAPLKFGSLLMAVWFLANSFANYLAGTLSSLYPDKHATSFLGYTMTNLYDFFILFVVMSGIASIILFGLSKWLQKLMNGVK
jgi:POT family proton-dependent oligopeptide transporter